MENLVVYSPFSFETREGTIEVEWLPPDGYDTRALKFEVEYDNLKVDDVEVKEIRSGVFHITLEGCEKNKEYTITVNAYQRKDGKHIARGVTTGITMDPLNPPTNIFADQASCGVVDIYMSSVQTSIDTVLKYTMQWKEVLFEGETFESDDATTESSKVGRFTLTGLDGLRIITLRARIEGARYISPWSAMQWITVLPDMSPVIATAGPRSEEITLKWRNVFPAGSVLHGAGYAVRWWRANESPGGTEATFIDAGAAAGAGAAAKGGFEYVLKGLEAGRKIKIGVQLRYGRYAREETVVEAIPCVEPSVPYNIRIRHVEGDKYELTWKSEHVVEVEVAGATIPCYSDNLTVSLKDTVPYDIRFTADTGIRSKPALLNYVGGTPCILGDVRLDGRTIRWGETDGTDIYVHIKDNQKIIPSVKSTTMTMTARADAGELVLPDDIILEQTTITVAPMNDIGRGAHVQVIFKYGKRITM
jgi:hypothetical protein